MCRGHDTHDHQIRCTCCDPAHRRESRHTRQMRQRGMPDDAKVDTEWARGTIQQRKPSARHRSEAIYEPAPAVRAERAQYGNLCEEEQGILAADESPSVRQALARNPRLTPRVREALASDEHPRVRAAARGRWWVPAGRMSAARSALRRRALALAESGADAVLDGSEAAATRVETALAAVPDVLDEAVGLTPTEYKVTNLVTTREHIQG